MSGEIPCPDSSPTLSLSSQKNQTSTYHPMKSLFITALLLLSLTVTSMVAAPNIQSFWIDCKPETSPPGDGSSEANAFHLGADADDCPYNAETNGSPNSLAYKFDKVMRTIARAQAIGRGLTPYNGSEDVIHIHIAPGYYYTHGTFTNAPVGGPIYDASKYGTNTVYPDPSIGVGFLTMPGWHIYGPKTNMAKITLVAVRQGKTYPGGYRDQNNEVFGNVWSGLGLTTTNSISDVVIQCNGRELAGPDHIYGEYIGLVAADLSGASVSYTNVTVLQGMGMRLVGETNNFYIGHTYLLNAHKSYFGSPTAKFSFIGCKVEDFVNGQAVGINSSGNGEKDLLVANNYVDLRNTNDTDMCFGTHGIDVLGSTNIMILNNTILGCKVSINSDTGRQTSSGVYGFNSYHIDQNKISVPHNSVGIGLIVVSNTWISRNEIILTSSNSAGIRIGAVGSIAPVDVYVTNNVVFGPGGVNAFAVHCDPLIPGYTHVGCNPTMSSVGAGTNIRFEENCFATNLGLEYPGSYTFNNNYIEPAAFGAIEEAECECVFRLSLPKSP